MTTAAVLSFDQALFSAYIRSANGLPVGVERDHILATVALSILNGSIIERKGSDRPAALYYRLTPELKNRVLEPCGNAEPKLIDDLIHFVKSRLTAHQVIVKDIPERFFRALTIFDFSKKMQQELDIIDIVAKNEVDQNNASTECFFSVKAADPRKSIELFQEKLNQKLYEFGQLFLELCEQITIRNGEIVVDVPSYFAAIYREEIRGQDFGRYLEWFSVSSHIRQPICTAMEQEFKALRLD